MNDAIDDIIRYRIERSGETLEEARLMFDSGHLHGAANRLYYSCFYSVSALLLSRDLSSSKHSGVMALFNRKFVKAGVVPVEFGRFYSRMFDMRIEGDYADFIDSPSITKQDISFAEEFVCLMKKHTFETR